MDLVSQSGLTDRFGRDVTYLRLSVTDRCDLRCTYCMAEKMQFLPRKDLLTLEELEQVCAVFMARGVKKIRISGGEPLVRRDIMTLFEKLGARLGDELEELTLTTNATRLEHFAGRLADAGVKRVNVSLDSFDRDTFARISRRDQLDPVLRGIKAAQKAGLRVKINTVVLKQDNMSDIPDMIRRVHAEGMDMTLIEVMPMGETGVARFDQYVPLPEVREHLEAMWTLTDMVPTETAAGPARYVKIKETGGKLGFITPLTNNFCTGCNRVRLTCTGRIYMCLGQEDHVDLRTIMREHAGDPARQRVELNAALDRALGTKPEKHIFGIGAGRTRSGTDRHMSVTGG